ncbi:serine proteinase stubble [Anabrus simplex]|uniref:serine proteinase stubble n=1 Tax=Anabrus simplex TaxID=316456 RepID=UPI0035A371D8
MALPDNTADHATPTQQPPPPESTYSCVLRGITPDIAEREITQELRATGVPVRRAIRIRSSYGPTYMVRLQLPTEQDVQQLITTGYGRNIRNLACVSRKTGETGVCMWAYSCMRANGTHLGTCIDRFYFGSCCRLDGQDPALVSNGDEELGDGNTHDNHLPVIPPQRPFTTTAATTTPITSTEHHFLLSTFQTVQDNKIDTTTEKTQSTSSSTTQKPYIAPTLTSMTTERTPPPTSTVKPSSTTTKPKTTTKLPPRTTATILTPSTTTTVKPVTKPPPSRTTTKKPTAKPKPTTTTTRKPSTKKPTVKPATTKPITTTRKPAVTTKKPITSIKPSVATTKKPTTSTKPSTVTKPTVTEPTVTKPILTTPRPSTTQSTTPEYILISSTNQTSTSTVAPTRATSTTTTPATTTSSTTTITTSSTTTSTAGVDDAVRQNDTASTSHLFPPITTSGPGLITWTMPVDTWPSTTSSTTQTSPTTSASVVESSTATSTTSSSLFTDGDEIGSGDEGSGDTTPDWVLLPVSTPGDEETSGTVKPSSTVPSSETASTSSVEMKPTEVSTHSTTVSPLTESTSTSTPSSTTGAPTVETVATTAAAAVPPEGFPTLHDVEIFLNMSDYKQVCGRRFFPESRIVGGEKASFGKWPWQISLRQWRTNTYLHKCGAALLNENWAITAAHCVESVAPADLLLRLGEHDLSTEEEPYGYQERRVQIVASHPQFDARTFEYDLALLRFYEPVAFQPNIVPICVPEDDRNFVGETAHVTGWGRLYEDGPLPSVLQEVSVPVINNSVCETMYRAAGYIEHIPDIFICAGWRKGGFDSCEGDSGGPMVIQRDDRRWLLAGIISWGIGCAEPNQPGVYTRISEFRDWINQILQF